MTKTLAAFLLDAAAWVAPPHRRQWIEGLRAEAAVAERPAAWAWGALTTALRQRLADMLVSGQALRLVLGGFVMSMAAGFAIFVGVRLPNIEAMVARAGKDPLPFVLAPVVIALVTLSGGLAILFSPGRPWLNRYGRMLFGLGGLYIGLNMAGTVLQPQISLSSAIVGLLFILAAPALLFKRARLFLALAAGTLVLEVAHCAAALPRFHPYPAGLLAVVFLNACVSGLMLLAGGGLLIPRRTPAAA